MKRIFRFLEEDEVKNRLYKRAYPEGSFDEERKAIIQKLKRDLREHNNISIREENLEEFINNYLSVFNIYPYPLNRIYQEEFLFLLKHSMIIGRLKTIKRRFIGAGIAVLDCIRNFILCISKFQKRKKEFFEKLLCGLISSNDVV